MVGACPHVLLARWVLLHEGDARTATQPWLQLTSRAGGKLEVAVGWRGWVRAACPSTPLVSREGFAARVLSGLLLEVLGDEASSCYGLS